MFDRPHRGDTFPNPVQSYNKNCTYANLFADLLIFIIKCTQTVQKRDVKVTT